MRKIHKKILTVCLALAMAVVMAVPAFADTTKYYITSWNNPGIYLNVDRSSTSIPAQGRALILYRTSAPDIDQTFRVDYYSTAEYYGAVVVFANSPSLAMNRSSSNARAILWPLNDGAQDSICNDIYIDFSGTGTDPTGFMLIRYDEFACYPTGNTGEAVYFKHYNNNFDGWQSNWRMYDTTKK